MPPFQFSLGRLMGATAFLSAASASASVLMRQAGLESASVYLQIAIWSFVGAVCIFIGDKTGAAIMVGATFAILALGFLLHACV